MSRNVDPDRCGGHSAATTVAHCASSTSASEQRAPPPNNIIMHETTADAGEYHYIDAAPPPLAVYENLRVLSERGHVRAVDRKSPYTYVETYLLHAGGGGSDDDDSDNDDDNIGSTAHLLGSSAPHDENIYENVCEVCCAVYSGAECDRCGALEEAAPAAVAAQPTLAAKVHNFTAGLLSSFRSRRSARKTSSAARRRAQMVRAQRPHIVHNVDTVFRTTASFDLNEIGRLKRARQDLQNQTSSSSPLSSVESLLVFAAASRCSATSLLTTTTSSSSASASYSSSLSLSSASSLRADVSSATSLSLSLREWMTSLRRTTIDYDEPIAYNIKCVPSVSFAACCSSIGRIHRRSSSRYNSRTSTSRPAHGAQQALVAAFERNLCAAKRRAICVQQPQQRQVVASRIDDAVVGTSSITTCGAPRPVQTPHKRRTPPLRQTRRDRLTHFYIDLGLSRRLVLSVDHLAVEQFQRNWPTGVCSDPGAIFGQFLRFVCAHMADMSASEEPLQFEVASVCDEDAAAEPPPPVMQKRNPHLDRTPPIPAPRQLKPFVGDAPPPPPLQRQSPVRRNRFGIHAMPPTTERRRHSAAQRHAMLVRSASSVVDTEEQQSRRRAICGRRPSMVCDCRRRSAPRIESGVYEDEAIYQDIWQFQTVGEAADDDAEFYEPMNVNSSSTSSDADNDDECGANDRCTACQKRRGADTNGDSSTASSAASSSSLATAAASRRQSGHWVVSDEFTFSQAKPATSTDTGTSQRLYLQAARATYPYDRVLVLIGAERRSQNQLLYNTQQPLFETVRCPLDGSESTVETPTMGKRHQWQQQQRPSDANNNEPVPPPVEDWKWLMRRPLYADDEEDVNLPQTFSPQPPDLPANIYRTDVATVSASEPHPRPIASPAISVPGQSTITAAASLMSVSQPSAAVAVPRRQMATRTSSVRPLSAMFTSMVGSPEPPKFSRSPEASASSSATAIGLSSSDIATSSSSMRHKIIEWTKRKIKPERTVYRSNTCYDLVTPNKSKQTATVTAATPTFTLSSSTVDGVACSSVTDDSTPAAAAQIVVDDDDDAATQPIFGAELCALEHKEIPGDGVTRRIVPRFVVECVRLIERPDNLRTHGIYRASGKKESIDRLKRKMNKTTKPWEMIEREDVHVITAGLKQFFRELRTALISSQLVERLPDNLESADSIPLIRDEIGQLEPLALDTLRFVVRHLALVDRHCDSNLMTAYNLAVLWGACLFPRLVAVTMDDLDTGDLMKKNQLVMVLIQRYDEIFEHRVAMASTSTTS